jgi:hypothetical protein
MATSEPSNPVRCSPSIRFYTRRSSQRTTLTAASFRDCRAALVREAEVELGYRYERLAMVRRRANFRFFFHSWSLITPLWCANGALRSGFRTRLRGGRRRTALRSRVSQREAELLAISGFDPRKLGWRQSSPSSNFLAQLFFQSFIAFQLFEEVLQNADHNRVYAYAGLFSPLPQSGSSFRSKVEKLGRTEGKPSFPSLLDLYVFAIHVMQREKNDFRQVPFYSRLFCDCFSQLDGKSKGHARSGICPPLAVPIDFSRFLLPVQPRPPSTIMHCRFRSGHCGVGCIACRPAPKSTFSTIPIHSPADRAWLNGGQNQLIFSNPTPLYL